MSVTPTPVFAQTPRGASVQTTGTGNTNTDGSTGSYSSALSVGANGSIIDGIIFEATVSSTAGLIYIFVAFDGSTYRLLATVATSTATISGTVAPDRHVWTPDFSPGPWTVPSTTKFKFSTSQSEVWNAHLCGSDL